MKLSSMSELSVSLKREALYFKTLSVILYYLFFSFVRVVQNLFGHVFITTSYDALLFVLYSCALLRKKMLTIKGSSIFKVLSETYIRDTTLTINIYVAIPGPLQLPILI
jgi:hypothetical protein